MPRFLPSYSPQMNPVEQLCGLMQKNATSTGYLTTRGKFADGTIDFIHGKVLDTDEECASRQSGTVRVTRVRVTKMNGVECKLSFVFGVGLD